MEVAKPITPSIPPRRGWLRRKGWWMLPLGLLVVVLLAAGLVAGAGVYMVAQIKASQPYCLTLELVRADAQVLDRLGKPIEDDHLPSQSDIHVVNDQGDAFLRFGVTGPQGRANVSSQLQRIAGEWGLTRVEVTFDDGQRIVLDTSTDDPNAPGDAPPWQP